MTMSATEMVMETIRSESRLVDVAMRGRSGTVGAGG